MMNGIEYIKTQLALLQIGRTAKDLKIEEFIETMEQAKTTAPVLDPTNYIKAADNMQAIEDLAKAILKVKEAHTHLFNTVLKTAVKGHMEKPPGD